MLIALYFAETMWWWHVQPLDYVGCDWWLLTWIDGRKHSFDVDFVLGSHDMQYLRGIQGLGTHTDLYKKVSKHLHEGSDGMCCGQYLAHAGIKGGLIAFLRQTKGNSSYAFRCSQWMFRRGDDKALAALDSAGPGRGRKRNCQSTLGRLSELYQDPLPWCQSNRTPPVESIDIWNS